MLAQARPCHVPVAVPVAAPVCLYVCSSTPTLTFSHSSAYLFRRRLRRHHGFAKRDARVVRDERRRLGDKHIQDAAMEGIIAWSRRHHETHNGKAKSRDCKHSTMRSKRRQHSINWLEELMATRTCQRGRARMMTQQSRAQAVQPTQSSRKLEQRGDGMQQDTESDMTMKTIPFSTTCGVRLKPVKSLQDDKLCGRGRRSVSVAVSVRVCVCVCVCMCVAVRPVGLAR